MRSASNFEGMMNSLRNQLNVQIYSKLAAAMSASGVVGADPSVILSLHLPGLYVVPNLDRNSQKTKYYVSNALDGVLACNWNAIKKPGKVSDIYKSILDGKQTPLVKLTEEQEEILNEANSFLFWVDGSPTEKYQKYLDEQMKYLEALDNFEASLATEKNGGDKVPEKINQDLRNAEASWKKNGYKYDVEIAIENIRQYESLEPAIFWKKLQDKFSKYTECFDIQSEFQVVEANPPYEHWFQEFGWSDFKFDSLDFDNQRQSGSVGFDISACCSCPDVLSEPNSQVGPISIFGSALFKEEIKFDDENFLLTCKLRRIEIVRPWLDINVFHSRAWRWSPASVSYGVSIASGGDIAGRILPTGVMPVLPMTAILARDVNIYWKSNKGISHIKEGLEKKLDLNIGPFRISRAIIKEEHRIYQPDPQIIGYISTILPKSPNPEPTLPWPLGEKKSDIWP
ncbi:hypothetical protein APV28_2723 [Comamonas testosteroni]|nr:hypothetical protein APV28_2723 [Comamonas testosteroni]